MLKSTSRTCVSHLLRMPLNACYNLKKTYIDANSKLDGSGITFNKLFHPNICQPKFRFMSRCQFGSWLVQVHFFFPYTQYFKIKRTREVVLKYNRKLYMICCILWWVRTQKPRAFTSFLPPQRASIDSIHSRENQRPAATLHRS